MAFGRIKEGIDKSTLRLVALLQAMDSRGPISEIGARITEIQDSLEGEMKSKRHTFG